MKVSRTPLKEVSFEKKEFDRRITNMERWVDEIAKSITSGRLTHTCPRVRDLIRYLEAFSYQEQIGYLRFAEGVIYDSFKEFGGFVLSVYDRANATIELRIKEIEKLQAQEQDDTAEQRAEGTRRLIQYTGVPVSFDPRHVN